MMITIFSDIVNIIKHYIAVNYALKVIVCSFCFAHLLCLAKQSELINIVEQLAAKRNIFSISVVS